MGALHHEQVARSAAARAARGSVEGIGEAEQGRDAVAVVVLVVGGQIAGVHGPAGCACADQRGLRSYEGACSPRARELEYTELDECPGADRGGFATVDARRPAPARRISGAGRGGAVAVENRACSSIPITVC